MCVLFYYFKLQDGCFFSFYVQFKNDISIYGLIESEIIFKLSTTAAEGTNERITQRSIASMDPASRQTDGQMKEEEEEEEGRAYPGI